MLTHHRELPCSSYLLVVLRLLFDLTHEPGPGIKFKVVARDAAVHRSSCADRPVLFINGAHSVKGQWTLACQLPQALVTKSVSHLLRGNWQLVCRVANIPCKVCP